MKRKLKNKNFAIELPLYHASLIFSIEESNIEINNNLRKIYNIPNDFVIKLPSPGGAITLFHEESKNFIIIINDISDHGNNSHEIFHIVVTLLKSIGLKLCDKSEEAYAYLIGHITREFYQNLKD